MLAIRNKEIETLRRISPQETESEEETEERGGKEAASQKKDREGNELSSSSQEKDREGEELSSSSQEKDNEEVKNGEGSSETPPNQTFPIPSCTEGYPRESTEMAKQLKHRADKEESIELKVQLYLSSIMFFVKSSINQDGTTRSQNGIDHGLKQTLDLARFVKNLTTANANSEEHSQKLSVYKVLALRAWFLIDHNLHGPQNKNLGDAYWKFADQLVSQYDSKNLFATLKQERHFLTQQSSLGELAGFLEITLERLSKSH